MLNEGRALSLHKSMHEHGLPPFSRYDCRLGVPAPSVITYYDLVATAGIGGREMQQREPQHWVLHVVCKSEDCDYNTDGHCMKDYIFIDEWQTCDDYEEKEEAE